ncbi:DUF1349 domain-containing protein [Paenibacillaceae bacterium]|nr:DUF1349 domain-containing protein [Paenibacillaceae bacterium]
MNKRMGRLNALFVSTGTEIRGNGRTVSKRIGFSLLRPLVAVVLCAMVVLSGLGLPSGMGTPVALASGTVYYVDSTAGSDTGAGTAPGTAWRSLDKVNSIVYQPGDSILFKAGGVWNGTLAPQGSGTSVNPIRIDRYGDGGKPLIAGGGAHAAVYFYNQEGWEVRNLEITNNAATPGQRRGIHVDGTSGGFSNPVVYQHFVFEHLDIHHVKGSVANDYARNGGIIVWGENWDYHVKDVTIQNNRIYSLDSVGIYLNGAQRTFSSGLKVANNVIYDVAADGAFILNTTDGVIEHNVVYDTHVRASGYHVPLWVWGAKDSVIQYNEVYNTAPGGDAMAYDADFNSDGTIIQYNYSHHNAGGFVLTVNDGTNASNYNTNTVIRYNISQNDAKAVFNFSGTPNNTTIYNNTVYIPASSDTKVVDYISWDGFASNTSFYNNIIYNLGSGGYSFGGSTNNVFEHNLFYGNHPASEPSDPYKIVADPQLASPGSGGIGRETLVGYQLLNTSPAIGAGSVIANNGGFDFFGNAVQAAAAPNIGAYHGPGLDPNNLPPLPEPPSQVNLLQNPGFETGDFTGWGIHYNGASVVNSGARTGEYAARLTGNYAGIEQTVTGLHPNTMYRLYAHGISAGGGSAVFGVKNHGNSEQSAHIVASDTSYGRKAITFTTGTSSTSATVFMYKAGGAGEVRFDDMELIQFSAAPGGGTKEPVFVEGTDDEFALTGLDEQWNWIRENSQKWSLTDRPGYMRIVSEGGDIVDGMTTARNILLTGAPDGDWTIETKLDGKPSSQWSQGGLIVYDDDGTYVRMTRLYGSGNQFQFTRQIDEVRGHVEVPDTIASTVSYMRVVKSGNQYSGYYSADGITYTQVWTEQTVNFAAPKIGLIVCAGTGLTADFDYFRILREEEPQPVNLLANGGFETGSLAGWPVNYGGASVTEAVVRSGEYAAKLSGGYVGVEQQVTGLAPNTTYRLSGWGDSANGGVAVFGAKSFGGGTVDAWGFENGEGYVYKEVMFTTGPSHTSATIYLYKGTTAGEVYFDDLELVEV